MPDTELGVGIIGGGKAGRLLAHALRSSGSARVLAVCTRHEASAKEAAEECGIPQWTTDYDAMLTEQDLDAVIVATPDEFHCEHAVKAAEAGKHILCEKPMCRSLEEADRMMGAAKKSNVLLMVGFTERFNQPCIDAKRRIDAGEIGAPRMILARRCHPRFIVRGRKWLNDQETGGVLNYAGTHNIDLICWFMGSRPERVYAEMGPLILKGQDFTDCAVMTFRFENGSIAALYETFAYPDKYPHGVDRSIEILGETGLLKVDFMSQPLSSFTPDGQQVVDAVTWPAGDQGISGAILAEVQHFIDCVMTGKQPLTTGEEGRLAIRIALAAREAANAGQATSL